MNWDELTAFLKESNKSELYAAVKSHVSSLAAADATAKEAAEKHAKELEKVAKELADTQAALAGEQKAHKVTRTRHAVDSKFSEVDEKVRATAKRLFEIDHAGTLDLDEKGNVKGLDVAWDSFKKTNGVFFEKPAPTVKGTGGDTGERGDGGGGTEVDNNFDAGKFGASILSTLPGMSSPKK